MLLSSIHVAVDPFRPHWKHKQCGGAVAAFGEEDFQCVRCQQCGRGIGAVIPGDTANHGEYFLCHPELEVILLSANEVEAHQRQQA